MVGEYHQYYGEIPLVVYGGCSVLWDTISLLEGVWYDGGISSVLRRNILSIWWVFNTVGDHQFIRVCLVRWGNIISTMEKYY